MTVDGCDGTTPGPAVGPEQGPTSCVCCSICRVPAFRVQGKIVAGFAAFKDHLSYLPFSGSVFEHLGDELRGYTMTKSALHFPVDRPLPPSLVEKLIAVRLDQIGQASR